MRQFSLGDTIEQTEALWVDACGNLYSAADLYTALTAGQRSVPVGWSELAVPDEAVFPVLVDGDGRPWVARVDEANTDGMDENRRRERHARIGQALAQRSGAGNGTCFPEVK